MGIQVEGIFPDMRAVIYYKEGWENTDLIGSLVGGYSSGSGSRSKGDTYFSCYVSDVGERAYVTDLTVDLTYIKKLIVRWRQRFGENPHYPVFIVSTSKTGNHKTYTKRRGGDTRFGQREDNIDVSDLIGEYYIRVHEVGVAANNREGKVVVYEIRGEKE